MSPRQPEATRAVYVRLPLAAAEKLDRAAAHSGASKRDVIASLLDRHVEGTAVESRTDGVQDPTGVQGSPRRVVIEESGDGLTLGHARFTPAPGDAVLTLEEAADLLRVSADALRVRAEAGDLPGRELDGEWRFRRDALLDWLGVGGSPSG